MLRLLISLLLLANLGYWAWTHGWMGTWVATSPLGDRDPARLARQVDPQTVIVLPAGAASRPAVAARAALPSCIEAGPFDGLQVEAAEAALFSQVPAGNWTRVRNTEPGVWIVYMGRYLDNDSLQRKQAELRRLRVNFETLQQPPELAPGLLLSRYPSRNAAEAGLDQLNTRGVRTARVVELTPPKSNYLLRIEGAEASLIEQMLGFRNAALGAGFAACAARAPGG
jgi:hypothetical protein